MTLVGITQLQLPDDVMTSHVGYRDPSLPGIIITTCPGSV